MTTPASIADVLNRAADLLSKPGAWGQGGFAIVRGKPITSLYSMPEEANCFCTIGAIARCSSPNDAFENASALADLLAIETYQLIGWNDEEGRTQDEVVSALRKAASLACDEGVCL